MIISCYSELEPFIDKMMMIAAAPEGTPPRRISDYAKNSLFTVLRRGPESGSIVEEIIFMVPA
jgi:hypothetical protein